jgi:hypothetical protein
LPPMVRATRVVSVLRMPESICDFSRKLPPRPHGVGSPGVTRLVKAPEQETF